MPVLALIFPGLSTARWPWGLDAAGGTKGMHPGGSGGCNEPLLVSWNPWWRTLQRTETACSPGVQREEFVVRWWGGTKLSPSHSKEDAGPFTRPGLPPSATCQIAGDLFQICFNTWWKLLKIFSLAHQPLNSCPPAPSLFRAVTSNEKLVLWAFTLQSFTCEQIFCMPRGKADLFKNINSLILYYAYTSRTFANIQARPPLNAL